MIAAGCILEQKTHDVNKEEKLVWTFILSTGTITGNNYSLQIF